MILLALLTALAISMALTPLLIRLAPRLGMVDMPDSRKVHVEAIPRVGGIGIVAGALTSLLLWLPMEPWLLGYLFGSVVLLVFGAADDSMELGHYPKFVGQFIAAAAVVYGGDLWVSHFPFLTAPLAPAWGKPFTVFALVGVMNAINHSDGLDGLAGGESLLSMGAAAAKGSDHRRIAVARLLVAAGIALLMVTGCSSSSSSSTSTSSAGGASSTSASASASTSKAGSSSSTGYPADKEQVCQARDQLQKSIDALTTPSLLTGGASAITAAVGQVQTDLNALVAAAKDDYKPQVTALQSALEQLQTAAAAMGSGNVAQNLEKVGTAIAATGTAAADLFTQLKASCGS